MQQYRVNYPLLIGLAVVGVLCAGAAYGLWRYQMKRHAGALLGVANEAEEEGDLRAAVQYLISYVSFRPSDTETRLRLANAYADLTEEEDVSMEEFGRALRMLEETVRKHPDEKDLRRRLVELYARIGRTQDALGHLGYMLDEYPDDNELLVLKAEYLARSRNMQEAIDASYDLIGYDKSTDTFDVEKAKSPHSVPVYTTLALMLRRERDQTGLYERVLEQLIKANPDSAEAYLARGKFYVGIDEPARGEPDIEKAYELSPEDPEVLLAMADKAVRDEEPDKAREFLQTGKTKYPDDNRFYQAFATLEIRSQDYEAALAQIDEGLEATSGPKARLLLAFKVDVQFRADDPEGMRETIAQMRDLDFRREFIDWADARRMMAEGRWYQASEALRVLQTRLTGFGNMVQQSRMHLGFCYEQLPRLDEAMKQYDLVLQEAPGYEPALAGKKRVLARLGKPETTKETDEEEEPTWQQLIAEELRKPEEERDWPAVEQQLQDAIAELDLEEVPQKIIWAHLSMLRGDLDRARTLLQEVNRMVPDDQLTQKLALQRLAVQVVLRDPDGGPEAALRLLDRAERRFGDQPALRLDRADIYLAMRGEQLRERLTSLTEGVDDWTDSQKTQLWQDLARRFLVVGMTDEGRDCWKRLADLQPDNLQVRRMLFLLALEANDDVEMKAAQEKILEITNDKNDSLWLLTEAQRLLSLYRRNQIGAEDLPDIRRLIDRAMGQRPEWHELHLAKADLELASGNVDAALDDFAKAKQMGPVSARATLRYISLLAYRGRFQTAKELVEEFPEATRTRLMGQLYTEALLRTGDSEAALEAARATIEADPDNAAKQLWFGQTMIGGIEDGTLDQGQAMAVLPEAAQAFQKTVELQPGSEDGWFGLVTANILMKDVEPAQEAMRDAQLVLNEDELMVFLARSYEILGRWFDAENMYATATEANPDNYALVKRLANFYLSQAYPLSDDYTKAAPLINQILRAGDEGTLPPNDSNLQWARRIGAKMLASTRRYPELLKAEKLLSSNAQQGGWQTEDRIEMARILAPRPEPASRIKAVEHFEAVKKEGQLEPQDELKLGDLYYGLNQWSQCRDQMLETIARYPQWPEPRKSYARKLISRGSKRELDEATRQLKKVAELTPADLAVAELAARLTAKKGQTDYAREQLKKMVPKVENPKDLTDQQVNLLELCVKFFVDLEDYDEAENIYRLLREYDENRVFDLAEFLGRYRDADQCFDLLQEVYTPDNTFIVLRTALVAARFHRDTIGDKYDPLMQEWFDRALRENPGYTPLLILQAELYDLQQRYEEAVGAYLKLLDNKDLQGRQRGIVLNNLSYMVSLLEEKMDTGVDPLELVQEAVQIFGPTEAVLDTRAVVYISREEYGKAIEDLELSLADAPTAVKYFHKALAHYRAGEKSAAIQAWEKAEELGLGPDVIDRMERQRYGELKAKMDELRPKSTTVTETAPRRAAG